MHIHPAGLFTLTRRELYTGILSCTDNTASSFQRMRPPAVCVSMTDFALGGGGTAVPPSLLLVDDDPAMRATLSCYFERCRFHVAAAATLTEAKAFFATRAQWTLVLADYHLPDGFGLELQSWIEEQRPGAQPPFLLMSGSVASSLDRCGVEFLAKPFTLGQLDARVRSILRTRPATSAP